MAQIKVLDLCNSDSFSELSYEDAEKVNGGTAGAIFGLGYSIYKGRGVERTLSTSAAGGGAFGSIGAGFGSAIGSIFRGASYGARIGGVYGASLSG